MAGTHGYGFGYFMTEERKEKMSDFKTKLQEVIDRYDYIIERYDGKDFTEIVGSIGGDVEKVRVYKDGRVAAK